MTLVHLILRSRPDVVATWDAYVDLNPIRAALAETLEQSDFTSVQRRIQSLQQSSDGSLPQIGAVSRDCFLAPLAIDERRDPLGACPHRVGQRCSDKGFLTISLGDYLQLLDWTARQTAPGKRGMTPADAPPIFERLSMSAKRGPSWSGIYPPRCMNAESSRPPAIRETTKISLPLTSK